MDAPPRTSRTNGRTVAALSLIVALLANVSNLFILGGVFTGPLAFAFAVFAIWRGRGWARLVGLVAAILAAAAFAISLALIYGLSHGCGDAPGCSD